MLAMIFVGVILNYLNLLKGMTLLIYIICLILSSLISFVKLAVFIRVLDYID